MLQADKLTKAAESWYMSEFAIPKGDAIHSAFVQLRLITSDLLDILDIESSANSQRQHEMLLGLFNADLDKWEKKWIAVFEAGETDVHRLYSSYMALILLTPNCSIP